MYDEDDWTPSIGWGIALRKASKRAGIVLVGLTVGLYLFWPVMAAIIQLKSLGLGAVAGFWMMVLVLVSSAVGVALASVIVRGLKADSALEGWRLLVPMLLIVTVTLVGACYLATALREMPGEMLIVPLCAMFLWSWVGCVVKLLIM